MKQCPINEHGEPKSLEEFKTEREMYESAKQSYDQAKVYEKMLASILK